MSACNTFKPLSVFPAKRSNIMKSLDSVQSCVCLINAVVRTYSGN